MVHMLGLDFYNFPHTAKGKRGRLKYEVYFERTEDGMLCLDVPKAEKKKGRRLRLQVKSQFAKILLLDRVTIDTPTPRFTTKPVHPESGKSHADCFILSLHHK